MGLGGVALSEMLASDAMGLEAPNNPLLAKLPHFAPKAKRVIYLSLIHI